MNRTGLPKDGDLVLRAKRTQPRPCLNLSAILSRQDNRWTIMARKTESSEKKLIVFEHWRPMRQALSELEREPPGKTYRHLRLILKEPEEPQAAA